MHGVAPVDPGRSIDRGRTGEDYAANRPGPLASCFARLARLGIELVRRAPRRFPVPHRIDAHVFRVGA